MDIGDGFYKLGMAGSVIFVTTAELISLLIVGLGLFAGRRLRACLAFFAMVSIMAAHGMIASSGLGWWRKVFLGSDPVEDLAWLAEGYDHAGDPPGVWLGFNAVCHAIVLLSVVRTWRPSATDFKQCTQQMTFD